MRLAAIDIGTNSVHMIVVRVRPDFSFEVIDREKEMVRLGRRRPGRAQADAGGDDRGAAGAVEVRAPRPLPPGGRDPGGGHQRHARGRERRRVPRRRSSARPASGPRIITGTEEARLIHLAAVYGVDTPKAAVVIDIGGGSVEITLGTGREVKFARSFKIGVIRLTERFVTSDPLSRRDERKMVRVHRRAGRSLRRAHRQRRASTG